MSASLTDHILREIQAELRTVRSENLLIRQALGHAIHREELLELQRALSDRIAAFEAHVDSRLDQIERSINERLERIEKLLLDGAR